MQEPEKVKETRNLNERLGFEADIFYHEESGKTTEDAERALGIESRLIIKCLLLKSKKGDYLGAIVRGSDRVNFKELESLSGYKGLRLAHEIDVKERLGFEIGGVPAVIFNEKGIRTYVDNKVLELEYVVGAGGDEHYGMKFAPRQLTEKLDYIPSNISI